LVSPPREEGKGPVRALTARSREVRPVKAERVKGSPPLKRLLLRRRKDNLRQSPREEGRAPESWWLVNDKEVIWERPQISGGRVPVKPIPSKESEITSPAPEQARPVHTGEEHLLATLAQLHSGSWDWILVELIRAHRAKFSARSVGERVGESEGETEVRGGSISKRVIFRTIRFPLSATNAVRPSPEKLTPVGELNSEFVPSPFVLPDDPYWPPASVVTVAVEMTMRRIWWL
jgi:hypothetical protein